MKTYFKNFPLVQYDNNIAVNIMARVAVANPVLKQAAAFYPYEQRDHKRADVISYQYYEDPMLDWLIYMSNGIIDPYYGWYLSNEQLNEYVAAKYGSVALAQQKTKHYEVNWPGNDTEISTAAYAALISSHKKYWAPNIDDLDRVVSYRRKQFDITQRTNKVISLAVANSSSYTTNENVYQMSGAVISAKGNVEHANTTHIQLKHIEGTFVTTRAAVGQESGTSSTPTSISNVAIVIDDNEVVYWTPITFYDYEENLNESKKGLKLLDKGFVDLAYNNLKSLMK